MYTELQFHLKRPVYGQLVREGNGTTTWQNTWQFSKKLNSRACDQAPHCQAQALTTRKRVSTWTCTRVSLEALHIVPNWEYPSPKLVSALQCRHTTEHYSATEKQSPDAKNSKDKPQKHHAQGEAREKSRYGWSICLKSMTCKTNLW